ncbi:SPOR domain-containing protein [Sulfurovum lithotrophicum]|uniref:SPOR domain-containing protein n=1 Tax=Sulfurovum lithotrophicum TaxID=206403 RepID=UPI000698C1E2|nr:SPOR domain-containing protein [Sulfurovum lithotrophicum]
MNDHNLDDLIIDNIEPKNNKAKSFLTIIALVIVVLIVAIVFTRTILDTPKNTEIALEENMSGLISPELTLQSTPKVKAPGDETRLSTVIEEKPKTPAATEEIKKETVVVNEKVTVSKKTVAAVPTPKQEVPVKKTAVKKEPAKPEETEKIVVPKKHYVKEETLKPAVKEKVVVPKTDHTASDVKYYIQVGSFSQTPSTRFLNTIKKHGFSYKITAPTANGTKKLLIGPYPSRTDADNALVRVKDRINKGAFIVKK